ncbi:RNA polymerase sigma factor [Longitalea luteola]|uniref:RNA polymerase sigma factor n=1 Tax=Longitalea luteola TaxID=2812563 RepID=UPI001A95CA0D|nr:sigma-70 family RNA polymerase sigma factor [Longitalea luteola]
MNPIAEIKKGDEVTFLKVYHQFHTKLFHYFLKRTRSKEIAKDLTQQSFIKLWQSKHTLSEDHNLDAQFFTIANSVFIDHLRRQAIERKYQAPLVDGLDDLTTLVYHAHTDYESADYLDAVAEDLPPVRKNVFMLKVAKGYSNKEIAEQLSVSIKTVEDHYSKALKHVRSLVTVLMLLFKILI